MKKLLFSIFVVLAFLLILGGTTNASGSITYFYGEPIKIENENISIVSNELEIDTTTSIVKNTFLLENISVQDIITEIIIPIENKELSITVNNLYILLDNTIVEYKVNENGDYVVKTKLYANSAKKLQILYKTDNDLLRAKVIKYNMENYGERTIGKVKVNIKIREKDIPLVEGIYPGHYTFSNNTISVEYYNYKVNTITKNIIVQKETYYNLQYGREKELTPTQNLILSKIDEWLDNGVPVDYFDSNEYNFNKTRSNMLNIDSNSEEYYSYEHDVFYNIIEFAIYKQVIKDSKSPLDVNNGISKPLLKDIINNYSLTSSNWQFGGKELSGKIVCIDFVETENGKNLYVQKNISGYEEMEEKQVFNLVLTREIDILKTSGPGNLFGGYRGAKLVFVGQGINGEDLGATLEEKVQYINSINSDMYIRVEIYDGNVEYRRTEYEDSQGNTVIYNDNYEGIVGYYNSDDYEMAKKYAIKKEEESNYSYMNEYNYNRNLEYSEEDDLIRKYESYEDYLNNYYKDYYESFYNKVLVKLSNDYISNNCEVPTIVQFIGFTTNENGKTMVNYFGGNGFYDSVDRGLITTNDAINTTQAKKLLANNKEKNENIKNTVENKINNLTFANNEEAIQNELKAAEKALENNLNSQTKKILDEKEIKLFGGILIGIIICLILLVINRIVKRRKNNGRKENKN